MAVKRTAAKKTAPAKKPPVKKAPPKKQTTQAITAASIQAITAASSQENYGRNRRKAGATTSAAKLAIDQQAKEFARRSAQRAKVRKGNN